MPPVPVLPDSAAVLSTTCNVALLEGWLGAPEGVPGAGAAGADALLGGAVALSLTEMVLPQAVRPKEPHRTRAAATRARACRPMNKLLR
ncbi:hypothetical protein GCM10018793_70550 [Streptomyces sulfonofaciens]|uniref:Uncharacterized protein n=1 Tax=Streptomyces sulfonofaciens TaxID=68272 RepID=A0A919GRL6_9ACTN|nr:hypothetical protein GCM10018793_70550 [Streptomyces sulfonofaciens]